MISILKADRIHIPLVVPLFDGYRVFYGQKSDFEAARKFLEERFKRNESVLFLALYQGKPVGFTQLYTTFSSASLQSIFILNDLFVDKAFRKKGIGEALLQRAQEHCVKLGYKGLALETETDNPAQKLYERLGWKKDSSWFHYFWTPE
ncbi:GNAT family N-acetyltransferase [Ulvibacterium sp.]|uniref:GNAT family N-acetyltransferase n=1 Tax=Ulvibacterium sp. TaxID=2665914 RepID=UPI003BA972C3